jgi:uncharacterized protein YihD (DUF1040 family)
MCSDCRESFPYRIYYSEQDFLESKADKWRVIFANNYRDIDGLDGPITDMFKAFDHLYLGTQRGLYRLPTKAQTIQTDNSTAFLGVGDFLSLPFRKLKSPDYAIGGIQSFLSRVNTEFGTFFIDTYSARPLLVTNQLNDLSEGLRNHWQENGDLKLAQQFKSITGVEYPVLEVTSPVGIGHISTFDPRTKRIIVHKKDYTINPDYLTNLVYSPTASITDAETLWFNGSKWYWNKDGSTTQEVSMDNAQYFTPEHFTLSYSFLVKNWVSFHSYFPYYMFNTDKTFFSNDLWEHGKGPHQNFYGMYYPHVVDLIAKQSANEIKYANNIYYLSKVQGYDSNHKNYYDVDMTFDGLIAYNDTQSTGYKDLIKKTPFSTGYNSSAIAVRKVDKKYRISEIRDYVVDSTQPIWSSNSQQLSSTPYLDKVPNTSNISFSKSLFELTRFRDHYLGIRLFFNPKQNYRITTDIVNTAFANRNR